METIKIHKGLKYSCTEVEGLFGKAKFATLLGRESSISENLRIPYHIDDYPVCAIGENAFSNDEYLTFIQIPDSVTQIGDSAFYNCRKLHTFSTYDILSKAGGAVTPLRLQKDAFRLCVSLETFTTSRNIVFEGIRCFQSCHELKRVNAFLGALPEATFKDCLHLNNLTFGSPARWDKNSIKYCDVLDTVTFLAGIHESMPDDYLRQIKEMNVKCPIHSSLVDWAYEGVNIQII